MHQFDENRYGTQLIGACKKAAATALRVNGGAASSDIVLYAEKGFADCARTYANRLHEGGLDDLVLVDAVHYVADVLVHGEVGTDVLWFDASLDALLELAAPSRALTPEAQRFIEAVTRKLQN